MATMAQNVGETHGVVGALAPTLFVGHHSAAVLTPISVCGASNISRAQAILPNASNGAAATVNATYYRIN